MSIRNRLLQFLVDGYQQRVKMNARGVYLSKCCLCVNNRASCAMSLSNAVSSLQLSEDRDFELEVAKSYVKYIIISEENNEQFNYYVHCAETET